MKTTHWVWAGLALTFSVPMQPRMICAQLPSLPLPAKASPSADAMPEYIEDFFLSDAVRSENRGELQLTVDAMSSRNHRSAADGSSAGLDLEYGLTDRLQLSMELPYGIHSTATSEIPARWSAISTGVLYQFIRSSHPFALSAGAGADLPLNSRGEMGFEPELVMAKVFGRVQVHASFEPEFSKDDTSLNYNLAAVRPWPHSLYPTLEFNGRRDAMVNSFYVTPGLYRRLPHRLEFGLGMPVGAGQHSSPIGAVFKMTWEVGGDEDDDDETRDGGPRVSDLRASKK